VAIDPEASPAQLAHECTGPGVDARPDGARQPVLGVVGDAECVRLVVERDKDDHQAEDLLARDTGVVVTREHRGTHEEATARPSGASGPPVSSRTPRPGRN